MISLLHPSRSRPEMAEKVVRDWYSKSKWYNEHILTLDSDDENHGQYLNIGALYNHVVFTVNPNKNLCKATNEAAKKAVGDLLIFSADDFFCPEHWDEKLWEVVESHNLDPKTDPFAIEINDNYQKNRNLLTMPIISRAMYEAEGHFWHPNFESQFCDNWIYERAKREYRLIDAYHLVFPHNHWSLGHYKKDEVSERNQKNYNSGKQIFNALCREHGYNKRY